MTHVAKGAPLPIDWNFKCDFRAQLPLEVTLRSCCCTNITFYPHLCCTCLATQLKPQIDAGCTQTSGIKAHPEKALPIMRRTSSPRPLCLHTHHPNLGHPLHPVQFGPPLSRSLQVSLTHNFPETGSPASGSGPETVLLRCCWSTLGSRHTDPDPPLPHHPLPPDC